MQSSKQGVYVKGVTFVNRRYTKGVPFLSTIAHILQPYNICVAHKSITTLRRLLTNVKDKDKPEDKQGAVYKIKGFLHW